MAVTSNYMIELIGPSHCKENNYWGEKKILFCLLGIDNVNV